MPKTTRTLRFYRPTPWVIAIWIFAQGVAFGLMWSFRESEIGLQRDIESLGATLPGPSKEE